MPKKARKSKKRAEKVRGNASLVQFGEITVNDYANSEVERKACSKKLGMPTIVKAHIKDTNDDDRAWDEKDDDEFEICSDDMTRNSNQGAKKVKNEKVEDVGGVEYPLDIWFLIGEKIHPEDVGRFAAICQATCHVVSSARFWFTLFRRYYTWTAKLPIYLDIHLLDGLLGLKATVIRSLFYTYRPFCTRISKEEPLSGHPEKVIGTQCFSQWRIKEGNVHKYFFLFAKKWKAKNKPKNDRQRYPNGLALDSGVQYNADDGCYIMEAISNAVCHIPIAMGYHVHSGQIGLSAGLCNHRLQLTLGPEYLLPRNNVVRSSRHQFSTTEIFQVIIEPVLDVRIYPWWHPQYLPNLPNHFSR